MTVESNLRLIVEHCVARSRFAAARQLAGSPSTVAVSSGAQAYSSLEQRWRYNLRIASNEILLHDFGNAQVPY
jgi:hypothetical protein